MKYYTRRKFSHLCSFLFGIAFAAGIGFFQLFCPQPVCAATLFKADSNSYLRLEEAKGDKTVAPFYEYLNLRTDSDLGQGALTFSLGGWGRVDLGHKSADDRSDGTIQHGLVSYRGDSNNLSLRAGRQFIAEGVATERLDGVYLRGDLAGGFTAAAFVGSPVVTEPNFNFKGGDITYGSRIAYNYKDYSTLGVSVLRTNDGGERLRDEAGIDLWLHPLEKLDITGRSSYNRITSGWMEHAYSLSFGPMDKLNLYAELSSINYRDYFDHVTTSALSLTNGILDPNEKMFLLGGSVEYAYTDNLRFSLDLKNYDYDIAGQANYYGGKASIVMPWEINAGFAIHRMDGETDKLKFDEYRIYAFKKMGKADLTADFFNVKYDNSLNGITNTYSIIAALGYDVTEKLKVSMDLDYGRTIDYDDRLGGLLKITYHYEKELGSKGGMKSE